MSQISEYGFSFISLCPKMSHSKMSRFLGVTNPAHAVAARFRLCFREELKGRDSSWFESGA